MRNAIQCCAAVGLMLCVVGCREKVELSRMSEPGTYRVTVDTETRQSFQGGPMDGQSQDVEMMMEMRVECGEVDADGEQTTLLTFERVRQEIEHAHGVMTYDSDATEGNAPILAKSLGALVGTKFRVVTDADGKVVEAEGLDAMWDEMARRMPDAAPMFEQMKAMLGDEAMSQMVSQQAKMLPGEPVGVGDTYADTMEFSVPMAGALTFAYDAEVLSIEEQDGHEMVEIAFDGTMSSEGGELPVTAGVATELQGMEFRQKGTMLFDATLGLFATVETSQEGEIHVTIDPPEQEAVEMVIDQKTDTKVTSRREEP